MMLIAAIAADTAAGPNHINRDALVARGLRDHIGDVPLALTQTIAGDLPCKCLQKVKRYLRREWRKPYDMKAHAYVNHIQRVNNEEAPVIPPAAPRQQLTADEVIDIILWGTPKSWQREMDRQGFDLMDETIPDVVAFMERIEDAEVDSTREKKSSTNGNGNK